jgi:hypothetical protein
MMKYQESSFRWGREHFSKSDPLWLEIHDSIDSISRGEVIAEKRRNFQEWRDGFIKAPAVGGQKIFNQLIDRNLKSKNWETQVSVFESQLMESLEGGASTRKEAYWSIDFKKELIGVEVSFNNAGALSQNLLRLSVLSESSSKAIRLGVLITSCDSLKKWSCMDGTVLTFESVKRVFPLMNFNIPTPIVVLGIANQDNSGVTWDESPLFPSKDFLKSNFGVEKIQPYSKISGAEKNYWDEVIESSDLD